MHLYPPQKTQHHWITDKTYPWAEWVDECRKRFKISPENWDRLARHQGIFIEKQRVEIPLAIVPEKSSVNLYYYQAEPPVEIDWDSLTVYDGNDFLVVNKPAGIPVQATPESIVFCLENLVKRHRKATFLQAAHRLDQGTSGLLVLTKTPKALALWQKAFSENLIQKTYLAKVSPPPKETTWTVTGYLWRDLKRSPQIYYRLGTKKGSKARWSETAFQCIQKDDVVALVHAFPKTGRTHQIRVHLAHSGFPVLGDPVYGKGKKDMPMHLHAWQLTAPSSMLGQAFAWEAPPPEYFQPLPGIAPGATEGP